MSQVSHVLIPNGVNKSTQPTVAVVTKYMPCGSMSLYFSDMETKVTIGVWKSTRCKRALTGVYLQPFFFLAKTPAIKNNVFVFFSDEQIDPIDYRKGYKIQLAGIAKFVFPAHC